MEIELKDLLTKQGEAFESFKKANDERLKAIESKGYAPADLTDKVEKINDDLSLLGKDIAEVAKKAARPAVGGQDQLSAEEVEHKQQFSKFVRKGDTTNLSDMEKKVFQMGSDVDGGYLITKELDNSIDRVASTISSVRKLAEVRTIGKESLKFRVKTAGVAARWVGEGEAGGESTNPKWAMLEISAEEMEVEPHAYNTALEDADFNIEADLAEEAGIGFGEAEGVAFVSGNGVKKPRGFLSYDIAANASYEWGKVGYIASGGAGAFAASNPGDNVINLLHSLKSQYRNGSSLLMADTTLASLRQIKDGSGHFYLFQLDPTGNFAGYVFGAPVEIDDNMPVIAANSYSIAYANWKRAYRIVDRRGITLIRDNITTKGTTKFNFRRRVGGGVKNFEAIKLMKFAAS
jgi:HK97 family phage major capsid protein